MALSLDDQLLGEKVDNYCSSDEGEQDSDEDRQQAKSEPKASNIPEPQLRDYNGFSTNVSDCFIYILYCFILMLSLGDHRRRVWLIILHTSLPRQ